MVTGAGGKEVTIGGRVGVVGEVGVVGGSPDFLLLRKRGDEIERRVGRFGVRET